MKSLKCLATACMAAGALALAMLTALPARAQWSQAYEQIYLPAEHNWKFRRDFPAADRLFNAFDYGHAVLYEELYTRPGAPAERLEEDEYRFLTEKLLQNPPHVPLEEGAIEVAYAKLAPEAKIMFEWAHILHRQIYDVLADERLSWPERDAEIAELLRYYKSRPKYAFSSVPKTMELMEGQYYSMAFREKYPKFNGLIWAYHWLQVGLYEPLMIFEEENERQRGVLASVARFWQLLEDAPANMPRVMPMTVAVAPAFAERYPEAAIIFDNLHALHDVISDILTSPEVPRGSKREEILRAAERYRDNSSFAMTDQEWREMAVMMGANNMGGEASSVMGPLPEPSVPLGATHAEAMQHGGMNHGNTPGDSQQGGMAGMNHGAAPGGQQPGSTSGMQGSMSGMNHGAMQGRNQQPGSMSGMNHGGTQGSTGSQQGGMQGMDHGNMPGMQQNGMQGMDHGRMGNQGRSDGGAMMEGAPVQGEMNHGGMQRMMDLHQRMMADPVIRERMMTDPVIRDMMADSAMRDMMADPSAHQMMGQQPDAETERAMAFVLRLLSDPDVEARIHASPRLHQLWSDPDVQAHLQMMQSGNGQNRSSGGTPQPAPSNGHQH